MSSVLKPVTPPWWRQQDWILTGAVIALIGISSLLIWSVTKPIQIAHGEDPNAFLKKQFLTVIVAIGLGIFTMRARYLMLRALVPYLYIIALIGLVVVLIPGIGVEINYIRAWIALPGGFTLQPSEFAKLAIVIGLAMVLAETERSKDLPGRREVFISLALVAVPAALIMLQPDFGTTMVIGATLMGLLVASGTPAKWPGGLGLIGAIGAVTAVTVPGILSVTQRNRLLVFLDPTLDLQRSGYTLSQVKLAISSGGMWGTGLFEGSFTNGRFVPEQQSDFIFSAAGEQLGFVGSALIIFLLFVVTWRVLRVAVRAQDKFGTIAAAGVACWIGVQAFENVGMNLGMMPVTGVPLPFVSYGGSSLFALCMAIGLVQNIRMKVTN